MLCNKQVHTSWNLTPKHEVFTVYSRKMATTCLCIEISEFLV